MHLHSKLLVVSSLCALCAFGLPANAAPKSKKTPHSPTTQNAADSDKVAALKKDLAKCTTTAEKLAFLKNNLVGQTLEVDASLGALIIQSTPQNLQKDVAGQVAQILAGVTGDTPNTPKVAALLTSKLPADVASSVAGSIAIAAASSAPSQLPQITAAVIVSQPSTIANAGSIAQEVTASAPLDMGSKIATAIGQAYTGNPTLVEQAPTIAADMTTALLAKGSDAQVRIEVAQSVAALTVLLPGTVGDNTQMIKNIGTAVAGVLSTSHPDVAATVVVATANALEAASGPASTTPGAPSTGNPDAKPAITDFAGALTPSIPDPNQQQQVNTVVSTIASTGSQSDLNNVPVSITPTNRGGNTVGQNQTTGNFTYPDPVASPTPTPAPEATPQPTATPETPV